MKKVLITWGLCLSAYLILASNARASNDVKSLVVGDGSGSGVCQSPTQSRIQDAIAEATPGADIHICPGIYPEVLNITKSLNLKADDGAVVMPSGISQNASSLASGNPLAAAVRASNATVNLNGLTVDLSLAGLTECSPVLVGILYQNASGEIKSNTVRKVQLLSPNLNGCQSGLGIFVQSGNGGQSRVKTPD